MDANHERIITTERGTRAMATCNRVGCRETKNVTVLHIKTGHGATMDVRYCPADLARFKAEVAAIRVPLVP